MRRNPLLLPVLAAALACSACFVPTIEELDAETTWACDADHACPEGFDCIASRCQPREGTACSPDETSPCGTDEGACTQGVRNCGEDGTFGECEGGITAQTEVCNGIDDDCDGDVDEELVSDACELTEGVCAGAHHLCIAGTVEAVCSAASYGADFESGAETSCDGADNDCDGETDEELKVECPLHLGVCAGAASTCTGGTWPECDEATYQQYDSRFEVSESTCDGVDNDCDGLADRGAPLNVSGSVAADPKGDAVALPGGGLLVLYQDGGKLRSRPVSASGQVGASVFPARTVEVATSAFSPALATDGTRVFAAWIEEFLPGSFRVMVAQLGTDGRSTATDGSGNALASPVSSLACLSNGSSCAQGGDCCSETCTGNVCTDTGSTRTFESVSLAVADDRLYVALITSGGATAAQGAVLPTVLPPTNGVTPLAFPLTDATRASLYGAASETFAAFETSAGLSVFSIDPGGAVTPIDEVTTPGLGFPQIVGGASSDASLFAASADRLTLLSFKCNVPSGCSQTTSVDLSDPLTSLRVRKNSAGELRLAWSETPGGGMPQGFFATAVLQPPIALPVGGVDGVAQEPLVFDADGQPHALFGAQGDLFVQWVCVPQ